MRCMIHPDIKPEMTETSYVELDTNTEEYITRSHDVVYCPQCFEEAAEEVAVAIETPAVTAAPKAEVIKVVAKPQASAPMTKAPGPQEIREMSVTAAPLKAERYTSKGAGSQVATNSATAAMTKPNFN